ncbi:hypothetical protein B0O99DRAFT_85501 [Bisporella sp. PMI_857]|nr:hypothetical protein B0O99DRAFT_85501 [Bisporella sp. PMI_857]
MPMEGNQLTSRESASPQPLRTIAGNPRLGNVFGQAYQASIAKRIDNRNKVPGSSSNVEMACINTVRLRLEKPVCGAYSERASLRCSLVSSARINHLLLFGKLAYHAGCIYFIVMLMLCRTISHQISRFPGCWISHLCVCHRLQVGMVAFGYLDKSVF